jgi:hypothetical protein
MSLLDLHPQTLPSVKSCPGRSQRLAIMDGCMPNVQLPGLSETRLRFRRHLAQYPTTTSAEME